MELREKIKNDLKESLKTRESKKLSVLKMLSAAIVNEEIRLKKKETGLTEEEILKVVKSEAKKRKDSVEAYTKAGRNDLAEAEKEELPILEVYLPEEMAEEEIEKIVENVIKKTNAESVQDFGKVMKEAMTEIAGQADGNRVSRVVKQLLSSNR